MDDFVLHSVNWQDGMLITRKHFEDQEKYLEELTRWFGFSPGDRYGLVCKAPGDRLPLAMNLTLNGDRLRVELTRCQAITRDGQAVEINESCGNTAVAEADVTSSLVPLYIAADSASRKQLGVPDPEESIPRLPFQTQEYALSLEQPPNTASDSYLQIAMLSVDEGAVRHVEDYYPPCVSVLAHDLLRNKARELRTSAETLLRTLVRAHEGLGASSGPAADVGGSLQAACRQVIRDFALQIASTVDIIDLSGDGMHPRRLIRYFRNTFRTLSVLLSLDQGVKDLLNQRYFEKQAASSITRFLSTIDGFLIDEYNHHDIAGHLRQVEEILKTTSGVFGFFAQSGPITAEPTETVTYKGRTFTKVQYTGYAVEEMADFCSLIIQLPAERPIDDAVVMLNKELFETQQWNEMQGRLGLNEAKRLGETDPLTLDATTFGTKVALRAPDMAKLPSVRQVNLVFRTRGTSVADKFENLTASDLILYAVP